MSFSSSSSSSSSSSPSPSRSSSKSFFKMQPQVRSISLPSRLHPSSLAVEEYLNKLKSWQSSSSTLSPLSLKTIHSGLMGLADLYFSTQNLIQNQSTRQALTNHNHGKLIEEALDGSITLINILCVVRDLVSEINDRARDLQSAVRRRGNNIDGSVAAYIGLRKKSKKEITKGIRELKQIESNYGLICPMFEIDPYLAMVVRVLREVNEMSIDIFRVLLDSISMPVMKVKGWSNLISKLAVNTTKSSGIEMMNEIGCVDYTLCTSSFSSSSSTRSGDVEMKLRTLEDGMQQVEGALDALFRCLVRNRVLFLNMLT